MTNAATALNLTACTLRGQHCKNDQKKKKDDQKKKKKKDEHVIDLDRCSLRMDDHSVVIRCHRGGDHKKHHHGDVNQFNWGFLKKGGTVISTVAGVLI